MCSNFIVDLFSCISFAIWTANSFRLICSLSNDTHHCENQIRWACCCSTVSSPIRLQLCLILHSERWNSCTVVSIAIQTKAQSNRVQWVKVKFECIHFLRKMFRLISIVESVHLPKQSLFRLFFFCATIHLIGLFWVKQRQWAHETQLLKHFHMALWRWPSRALFHIWNQ